MVKKVFRLLFLSIFAFLLFSCAPISHLPPIEDETDLPSVTEPTQAPDTLDEGKRNARIMIDAGHGEIDPGAMARYGGVTYNEKDINLSVALLLRDELIARGYTVLLTREDDMSLLHGRENIEEIKARCDLALNEETDLYISLHCNSYEGVSRAYGPIIFYREKVEYEAKAIAEILQNAITEGMTDFPDTRECRARRDDDYAVLKKEGMPTLLFEMGFLTDESDAMQLIDADWQRALSIAIADGIDALYGEKYID